MKIDPPRFDNSVEPAAMRQLVELLKSAFGSVVSTRETSPYLLLSSPDGSVWKVTIDDTGVLGTAKLPLGKPL
jgi:hypothetical protein